MKLKRVIMMVAISTLVLAGCGQAADTTASDATTPEATVTDTQEVVEETTDESADAMTTASIVNDEDAFLNAIGSNGTWIIATLKDMSFDQDLVLEGEFTNKDLPARKIALYEQDADRNITASYTLTAPKLTVKSENARIQGGTFVGDVYVEAPGFTVVAGTVEGNIYFMNEEAQATFTLGDGGSVTGVTELK